MSDPASAEPDLIKDLLTKPIPKHLWHYTSYAAFQGIVVSKKMFTTDLRYLNDRHPRTGKSRRGKSGNVLVSQGKSDRGDASSLRRSVSAFVGRLNARASASSSILTAPVIVDVLLAVVAPTAPETRADAAVTGIEPFSDGVDDFGGEVDRNSIVDH
jgi:hypothetical protein